MIGYYDLVLGLVPLSLLGVTGGLYGIGVDLAIAVPLAAALAAGVIGHGLFVNAPVEERPAPDAPGVAAD
ncbi:MAG TPA: hypothetical protein VKA37_03755 [Halobacteriales archaeon]|nr:hypothetical protein [Halobacteriales archaeon]